MGSRDPGERECTVKPRHSQRSRAARIPWTDPSTRTTISARRHVSLPRSRLKVQEDFSSPGQARRGRLTERILASRVPFFATLLHPQLHDGSKARRVPRKRPGADLGRNGRIPQ